jgi:SAM-dependent methyltransferase
MDALDSMTHHNSCRACGAADVRLIVDLGLQPLANNFLRAEDLEKIEPRFPLRLLVCPACWLLQIADIVPPVELFTEYLYFTSYSDSMLAHAREAAERYVSEFSLSRSSYVIEIASNDGYMLQNFQRAGVPCLGIEPAARVAAVAQEKGIDTLIEFFDAGCARRLAEEGKRADLILANNVFAHAPDINGFLAGLRQALKPSGQVILEFPYAVDLLEKTEFDTIYHEHVFYFTLTALQPLFAEHGLSIFHVERLPLHGGSLRLFASQSQTQPVDPSVEALLAQECEKEVGTLRYYERFASDVIAIRDELRALIDSHRASGQSIAAYGASAKGSTLLNFCDLDHTRIDFVADRSPYKQGRLTPGTHIPIVPPDELRRRAPGYALLLTWNFAEEILRQQQAYRDQGGKFIVPIPRVVTL